MARKYIYRNVAAEMKRNCETQKDICDFLGITEMTLRKKLLGVTQWNIGEIEKLCEHYNKDYYELFDKE